MAAQLSGRSRSKLRRTTGPTCTRSSSSTAPRIRRSAPRSRCRSSRSTPGRWQSRTPSRVARRGRRGRRQLRPLQDHQGRGVQRREGLFESRRAAPTRSTGSRRSSGATAKGEVHASVSDRTRFPVIFELYSTRFGTATPNPDLGPERATSLEAGMEGKGDAQRAPGRCRLLQRRARPDSDRRAAGTRPDAECRRRAVLRSRNWGRRELDPADTRRELHRSEPHDQGCAAAEPSAHGRADAQGIPVRRVAADPC